MLRNKANMTTQDYVELFEAKLAADAINVPHDFYEEEVMYKHPKELMVIYLYLEE